MTDFNLQTYLQIRKILTQMSNELERNLLEGKFNPFLLGELNAATEEKSFCLEIFNLTTYLKAKNIIVNLQEQNEKGTGNSNLILAINAVLQHRSDVAWQPSDTNGNLGTAFEQKIKQADNTRLSFEGKSIWDNDKRRSLGIPNFDLDGLKLVERIVQECTDEVVAEETLTLGTWMNCRYLSSTEGGIKIFEFRNTAGENETSPNQLVQRLMQANYYFTEPYRNATGGILGKYKERIFFIIQKIGSTGYKENLFKESNEYPDFYLFKEGTSGKDYGGGYSTGGFHHRSR